MLERDHHIAAEDHIPAGALEGLFNVKIDHPLVRVVSCLPHRSLYRVTAKLCDGVIFLGHIPNEIAFIGLWANRLSTLRKRKAGEHDRDKEETKPRRRPAH
jgi:hypothetical protein